ncbi:MAG: D-glycero-beta-D-manno-heptose 1-phosphate adenylyltransferase [Candidatus Marinimicrobia bacterium]|jgi:D-beta-D-heptose 7-phosphate kinase/D-beta-D-heptose 1-phosphate adenosyltransferase|nr:D-glycero-beta-D-manno-heptose 1-phosphate adenylyltransferase [Candidatus Neomarinimicrobiota bacterium]
MAGWTEIQTIDKVRYWKELKNKIVFTNGCFDILHAGHVHLLTEAKSLGDRLLIGLNSDQSIQNLKGLDRPLNPVEARASVLESLSIVDGVTIFQEDTPYNLIKKIIPHVLVKGGDYSIENVVGADTVREAGGEVALIPILKGYSTSDLITRIQKN